MTTIAETRRAVARRPRFLLDRAEVMGPMFIAPAILYVLVLVGLPFLLALYYGVSAYSIFDPSYRFVGLKNLDEVLESEIFWHTLWNTLLFTIGSQIIGLLLGKIGAMLLMKEFPGRGIARALVILPWAVPVSLATLAWKWMFDSLYSVINWTLVAAGLVDVANQPQWLGQQDLAFAAVMTVHAWRLFPFGVIIFLAGFASVPKDVLDAATVDGAGFWRRNYQIILPIIAPIVVIALIFGTVFTFTDLSVVYLLTMGGPMNSTQVLGSLAFQVGILSGDVAHGAVICLFMFPFLLVAVIALLRALRRREI
ncbi:sugar ABC transporter permease [Reyranella sp.]|jgi:multiple sugar transport system permease protein|uniref:carbohydrate ABC transporter permease n=1 Tax=Reyranella sp. TaxID=1929291 RepID=UPI002F95082D